jgi:integrase
MPMWARIAKAAGLEGRVFHELRHGHGYMLARAGVSQRKRPVMAYCAPCQNTINDQPVFAEYFFQAWQP